MYINIPPQSPFSHWRSQEWPVLGCTRSVKQRGGCSVLLPLLFLHSDRVLLCKVLAATVRLFESRAYLMISRIPIAMHSCSSQQLPQVCHAKQSNGPTPNKMSIPSPCIGRGHTRNTQNSVESFSSSCQLSSLNGLTLLEQIVKIRWRFIESPGTERLHRDRKVYIIIGCQEPLPWRKRMKETIQQKQPIISRGMLCVATLLFDFCLHSSRAFPSDTALELWAPGSRWVFEYFMWGSWEFLNSTLSIVPLFLAVHLPLSQEMQTHVGLAASCTKKATLLVD